MSKLFNLKEWLTLADAARHLSIVFGEEVTEPDILRLALDKRLKLSVWFVNHAQARKGKLIPLAQCRVRLMSSLWSTTQYQFTHHSEYLKLDELKGLPQDILDAINKGDLLLIPEGLHYSEHQFLILEDKVESIGGVWDLAMVGGEALDVEHRYQIETGGPDVTLINLEGPMVERDGVIAQLQDKFDNDASDDSKKGILNLLKKQSAPNRYYPAGSLPADAIYVVRTAALRELEQLVLHEATPVDKPLAAREETTYINIIGGLLGLMRGKTPAGKAQSVFDSETAIIDALLAEHAGKPGMAARTLQEKFAAAKRALKS